MAEDKRRSATNPNGNARESDQRRDEKRDRRSQEERSRQARENQKKG